MKAAIGSLTLALTLIVTPAAAAELLVPPKEYDLPYKGTVIVVPANSQKQVRAMCPKTKFNLGVALGCAEERSWGCRVIMAPDAEITAAGFPPELVKRHEIAHCNGWPADHRGALPYEEWAETDNIDTPPTPPSVTESRFAVRRIRPQRGRKNRRGGRR
jgi:hypothetical protein